MKRLPLQWQIIIDRPLDMCRTVVNVTGDAMVSVVVARTLGKLHHVRSSRKE